MSDSSSQSSQLPTPPPATVGDDDQLVGGGTTGTDPGAADAPNPLDALEQILKDAKAKAASKGAADKTAPAEAPPAAPPAVDEATRKAEIAVLEAEQVVEDNAAIDEQLSALKQVVETPAYIARVEQDKQKKKQDDDRKQQADDFAIVQIGHTKI